MIISVNNTKKKTKSYKEKDSEQRQGKRNYLERKQQEKDAEKDIREFTTDSSAYQRVG